MRVCLMMSPAALQPTSLPMSLHQAGHRRLKAQRSSYEPSSGGASEIESSEEFMWRVHEG